MASAFAHAFSALAMGTAIKSELRSPKFWILGIVCSTFPDLDVIAFDFGIPYEHMLGHRGITHSILFGLFFSYLIMKIFYNQVKSKAWLALFIYFSLCCISHGILDAMTTGGRGIAFFAPFSDERYFLPWRVIRVSPMSVSSFFGPRAWRILANEAIWVGIPFALFAISAIVIKRTSKSST